MNIKIILAAFAISSFMGTAFAKALAPCNEKQLIALEETIADWSQRENYTNVSYLKNSKNETVGFFSWNDASDSMYAEVCESMPEELTIADHWYYWDASLDETNPASWKKDEEYGITQDEGTANFKVIKTSKTGNIKAKFTIIGWDENSHDIVAREDVVTFQRK
jgi:hypothetical protein